jgi:DNA-directed RNA polymerase subunit delta
VQEAVQHQNLRHDLSVTDIAYQILKDRREPIKYKELVEQVLELKGTRPGQDLAKMKAKIHTEISLDSRFMSRGAGLCGLREWTVKPPAYKVLEVSSGDRPKPGERLRKELVTMVPDDDYNEDSDDTDDLIDDDESIEEPEEPEEPEES